MSRKAAAVCAAAAAVTTLLAACVPGMTQFSRKGQAAVDQSVSDVITAENEDFEYPGELFAEGHDILGAEEQGDTLSVYVVTCYGEFGFENGNFVLVSGSYDIPAVVTLTKDGEGAYSPAGYREASDGDLYLPSLREMFPPALWSVDPEKSRDTCESQMRADAEGYLGGIGRDAPVTFDYVEKESLPISAGAYNALYGIEELYDYPDWLGTRETVEDGERFMYRTAAKTREDGAVTLIFTREREDGSVIGELRYEAEGDRLTRVP